MGKVWVAGLGTCEASSHALADCHLYSVTRLGDLPSPLYYHLHIFTMSLKKGMPLSPDCTSQKLMEIDSHPSSAAFDVINQTLQANEADRKDALGKAKAIFAFNLKNSSGEEAAWYLDLKNKGEVGQGSAPAGDKADGEFTYPVCAHWCAMLFSYIC